MNKHETINYLEIPTTNIKLSEKFFKEVFSWSFEYYGEHYMSFKNENIEGGFFTSNVNMQSKNGSCLIVFYSEKLDETYNKILIAGGRIVQDTFSFPGGKRFHFEDLTGNEYGVWSKE